MYVIATLLNDAMELGSRLSTKLMLHLLGLAPLNANRDTGPPMSIFETNGTAYSLE